MKHINNRQRKRNRSINNNFKNAEKVRVYVFRSNKYTYVHLFDNVKNSNLITFFSKSEKTKVENAFKAGSLAGQYIIQNNIKSLYFDKSGYLFSGRIKAVVEGLKSEQISI